MPASETSYVTVDVFTNQRFKGNQLAVVDINNVNLSSEKMQQIAREFNFSETIFLRQPESGETPQIRIFTPVNEMEFAGHPVIGGGHVLFRQLLSGPSAQPLTKDSIDVKTNAGIVTLKYNSAAQTVSAEIPHNVHIHSATAPKQAILDTQSSLTAESVKDSHPISSIVKGVTYVLVDFTDHADNFAAVKSGPCPAVPLDDGWSPSFVGTMYYRVLGKRAEEGRKVYDLRVRMIAINLEDPACGSGSCSLAVYLALQEGGANAAYRFYLDQGSEIGRDSNIIVDVVLNERGDGVSSVLLSGQAAPVTRGQLLLPE
ncbi:hypothetical protein NM208_g13026 [Fusarium decemcellulare]|uniref:Uncharacterized protein n=1 Tax=Fusarium decemcellulare TaxID=57161 RepID=A0ACC1RND5_9HYPO|nr:hypothetical protein NM208_g13026 [Fusarium decemcellulare]